VSDLHIGDRSRMDNLRRSGREVLFDNFLEFVQERDGQLVILGDFFELLRYPLDSIITQRLDLLDRLAAMNAVYVPGNHDADVLSLVDPNAPPHPFFAGMRDAFTQPIGTRRFRFMHGHEIDPFVNVGWKNVGRMIGAMTYRLELRRRNGLLRRDPSLWASDPALRLRRRIRCRVTRALREGRVRMSAEKVRLLTRQIRTQHMMMNYSWERADRLYDVAIAGHTHHAAAFGGWFYNSGSWTGRSSDFLLIDPAGQVELLHWTRHGPQTKAEILAA
jgi:UDP-2,3-diacylglucosamine pyrophosphatase LpxH